MSMVNALRTYSSAQSPCTLHALPHVVRGCLKAAPCSPPPLPPFSFELESTRNRLNCKDREGRAVGNQLEARLQSTMTSKSYNRTRGRGMSSRKQTNEQSRPQTLSTCIPIPPQGRHLIPSLLSCSNAALSEIGYCQPYLGGGCTFEGGLDQASVQSPSKTRMQLKLGSANFSRS